MASNQDRQVTACDAMKLYSLDNDGSLAEMCSGESKNYVQFVNDIFST